jgi:GNAT superfamily N-acetyltransferase
MPEHSNVLYKRSPAVSDAQLNALFQKSWPHHNDAPFAKSLAYCLDYVCAYQRENLVGFVKIAWDGGRHAFVLDTTVHPMARKKGVGSTLVREALALAFDAGVEWAHVDYEPDLEHFYAQCGFRRTLAGLARRPAA